MASSLLSGLSGYVDIGLVLLWIYILLYLFPPASSQGPCCCSGIDLHLERVSFLSGMTAAWSHGVYTCMLLFVQMNVVPSGI